MVAVGEFAIIFVLPLYLINALGLSVMGAGLVLAAMAIGAFFSGASARHLAARFGSPGTVLIGLVLELVGVLALVLLITGSTPGWIVAIPLVVYGVGLGLASAQLTGTVLRDVPVGVSGQASATQSTVRQIGSALGTAFAGAALSVSLAVTLPSALTGAGITGTAADELAASTRQSAGTVIARLRGGGPPPRRSTRSHRDSPTRRAGRSSWHPSSCSSASSAPRGYAALRNGPDGDESRREGCSLPFPLSRTTPGLRQGPLCEAESLIARSFSTGSRARDGGDGCREHTTARASSICPNGCGARPNPR